MEQPQKQEIVSPRDKAAQSEEDSYTFMTSSEDHSLEQGEVSVAQQSPVQIRPPLSQQDHQEEDMPSGALTENTVSQSSPLRNPAEQLEILNQIPHDQIGGSAIVLEGAPTLQPEIKSAETCAQTVQVQQVQQPQVDINKEQGASKNATGRTIFAYKIPRSTTRSDMINCFSQFGEVQNCDLVLDKWSHHPKYGFVTFASADAATKALSAQLKINGVEFKCDLAKHPRPESSRNAQDAAPQLRSRGRTPPYEYQTHHRSRDRGERETDRSSHTGYDRYADRGTEKPRYDSDRYRDDEHNHSRSRSPHHSRDARDYPRRESSYERRGDYDRPRDRTDSYDRFRTADPARSTDRYDYARYQRTMPSDRHATDERVQRPRDNGYSRVPEDARFRQADGRTYEGEQRLQDRGHYREPYRSQYEADRTYGRPYDKFNGMGYKDTPQRDERPRDDRYKESRFRDGQPRNDRFGDSKPRDEQFGSARFRDERPQDNRMVNERVNDSRPRDVPFRDDRPRDGDFRANRLRDDGFRDQRPREDRYRDERPRDGGFGDARQRNGEFRDERPRDSGFRDDRFRDNRLRDDRYQSVKPRGDFYSSERFVNNGLDGNSGRYTDDRRYTRPQNPSDKAYSLLPQPQQLPIPRQRNE